ncbi:MAG TPA: hypothetical protein VEF06_12585 [Bryobacteraceae bacterium]|nr:hypothetical protein [Bryobacteraceae bacterium]
MSFLDNLENDLKALESQEQGGLDERRRREGERARSMAAAPWAEKLKNGPYTKALMGLATRAGFARRVKVHMMWLGTTLRLEAGDQRLELRPAAKGVVAVAIDDGREVSQKAVDLDGNPQKLVDGWMETVDARRRLLAEQAPPDPAIDEEPEGGA